MATITRQRVPPAGAHGRVWHCRHGMFARSSLRCAPRGRVVWRLASCSRRPSLFFVVGRHAGRFTRSDRVHLGGRGGDCRCGTACPLALRTFGPRLWGYEDVLPYFSRMKSSWRGAGRYHGDQGPLHVRAIDTTKRSARPASQHLACRPASDRRSQEPHHHHACLPTAVSSSRAIAPSASSTSRPGSCCLVPALPA